MATAWFHVAFEAAGGLRGWSMTGVQTCVLVISSRRRHTRLVSDWSSDVCSSDLKAIQWEFVRPRQLLPGSYTQNREISLLKTGLTELLPLRYRPSHN